MNNDEIERAIIAVWEKKANETAEDESIPLAERGAILKGLRLMANAVLEEIDKIGGRSNGIIIKHHSKHGG